LTGEGDPDRGGQPWSQAAGSHFDAGQAGQRVTFQQGAEATVIVHQYVVEDVECFPGGLEQWRGVPFGQHEVVVGHVRRV
jgi:hypothetical protein